MSALRQLSHVASPRECDTRHTVPPVATSRATAAATTPRKPASVRDLARDTLARQQRDKGPEWHATRLRQAIDRCCDARGDDDGNRAALIEECAQLPPAGQDDMREHFEQQAERWESACGLTPEVRGQETGTRR
jgi:hypothetical protein